MCISNIFEIAQSNFVYFVEDIDSQKQEMNSQSGQKPELQYPVFGTFPSEVRFTAIDTLIATLI